MEKYLSYDDMLKVCEKINEKYLPDDTSFLDKVDQLFEQHEDKPASELLVIAFQELLDVVDNEINKIESAVNIKPTCFKGCSYCCYFPIITTRLEAKLMIQYMNQLPDDEKQQVLAHLENYFEKNQPDIDDVCSLDFQQDADFKLKYISAQVSCPMLNLETNTCMAYKVRPIPCRTYLNYSNPQVCADTHIPKEPFSFEFFEGFYMGALNELVQELLYEDEDLDIEYPNDLFEYNYLPVLLKEELAK